MKIYLDVIFLINFLFDSLLLFSVSVILKRNIKLKKIFLGGLIGGISIFILFLKINNIELFLIKILISILMTLITFSFKNIKYTLKNLLFLYTSSMILGGFLYFINCEFAYKREGLIFFHNNFSLNFIVLVILSPIIIYIYIRQAKELKNNYSYYYKIDVFLKNNKILKLNAYLDTGNKLTDPYLNRPIIIIDKKEIDDSDILEYILVPVDTINNHTMLKCITVDKVYIEGYGEKKNILLGISPSKIKMEGINCLLQPKILEG